MASVLVVADDLTGSNATGARFARVGLPTVSVPDLGDVEGFARDAGVVVCNTDSRHVSAEEAASRVTRVVDAVGDVALVVKRTDTTLRGNIGAELLAALEAVRRRHAGARALMVPAFPSAGRVTVGGIQLVDGVPVGRSAAASDHLNPVTSSRVAEIVRQQVDVALAEVHLDTIHGEPDQLVEALAADVDVLIADATERRDLATLAAAAVQVSERDGVHWMTVDPGPFGPELATSMGLAAGEEGRSIPPLLMIVGSVSRTTREQSLAAEQVHNTDFLDVDVRELDVAGVVEALVSKLRAAPPGGVVGLRTAVDEGSIIKLDADRAERIPAELGEITRKTIEQVDVGGIYVTGGDVTVGVVRALGGRGIAVDDEVLPLAVTGRLVGGPHEGLRLVTKGGLIGDRMAAVTCIDELRSRSVTTRKAGT